MKAEVEIMTRVLIFIFSVWFGYLLFVFGILFSIVQWDISGENGRVVILGAVLILVSKVLLYKGLEHD